MIVSVVIRFLRAMAHMKCYGHDYTLSCLPKMFDGSFDRCASCVVYTVVICFTADNSDVAAGSEFVLPIAVVLGMWFPVFPFMT